ASRMGLPPAAGGHADSDVPTWLSWVATAVYFTPGAILGGVAGWFLIRPVNAALAVVFRGFNRSFDVVTAVYGQAVSRLLRVSLLVLLAYGGLLYLTYWSFTSTPTGFIPAQDKGYLLVNVQLPDAASVGRTQGVVQRIADRAVAAGESDPQLQGLFSSFRADTPWLELVIDRAQAKDRGVSIDDVRTTLEQTLGPYYINDFNRFGRTWQVNVQARQEF